jgi:hypothetical protein
LYSYYQMLITTDPPLPVSPDSDPQCQSERDPMATSTDPPLSDYEQTMALFVEFLGELRNWRKVADLQHDGVTVFRCTFTFAQLMQPSIDMDIVRVDSFDELPDRSVQPGAAAFALSASGPGGGPAAPSGGGWDGSDLPTSAGGTDFPGMTGSSDRAPDRDYTRVWMPGPPFLPPFGQEWPLDYRAIWGDADGNAPDPAETGPRPRMGFGQEWTSTEDWLKQLHEVMSQGIVSKMPALPPHLLGDTPEYTIHPLIEPVRSIPPVISATPDNYVTGAGDHTASLASTLSADAPRPGTEAVSTGTATVSSEGPMISTTFGPGGTTTTDTVSNDGSPEQIVVTAPRPNSTSSKSGPVIGAVLSATAVTGEGVVGPESLLPALPSAGEVLGGLAALVTAPSRSARRSLGVSCIRIARRPTIRWTGGHSPQHRRSRLFFPAARRWPCRHRRRSPPPRNKTRVQPFALGAVRCHRCRR